MKKIIFAGLFLLSMVAANGQEVFSKGTQLISAGMGVGYGIPIEISYERSIVDGFIMHKNGAIGVGAYGGWYHRNSYGQRYNHYLLGVRGMFHYQFIENLDTYGGLMLYYDIERSTRKGDGKNPGLSIGSIFDYSLFAGARYYIKPKLGIYGEVGYGISYLSAGVTFKL
ncbi:MAG: hypothetical protein LBC47_01035 [Tannerella sp.]|nr:hypothetical protein [Tannerella sp.]